MAKADQRKTHDAQARTPELSRRTTMAAAIAMAFGLWRGSRKEKDKRVPEASATPKPPLWLGHM